MVAVGNRVSGIIVMTAEDIVRIEAELGHHVPYYYREFILANTDELELLRERGAWRVIHTDPDGVIDDNQRARQRPHEYPPSEDGQPWLVNCFIVGNTEGNYWFIHRDAWDLGLWYYRFGSPTVNRLHASLLDYLDWLQADLVARKETWGLVGHRA